MDRLREALPVIETRRPKLYHSSILLLNDHGELSRRRIQGHPAPPGEEQELAARLLTLAKTLAQAPLPPVETDPLGPVMDGTVNPPVIVREPEPPPAAETPAGRRSVNWLALLFVGFLVVAGSAIKVVYDRAQTQEGRERSQERLDQPATDTGSLRARLGNLQFHDDQQRKLRFMAGGGRGMTPDYKFELTDFDDGNRTARGQYYDSNTRLLGDILIRVDPEMRTAVVLLDGVRKVGGERKRYTQEFYR